MLALASAALVVAGCSDSSPPQSEAARLSDSACRAVLEFSRQGIPGGQDLASDAALAARGRAMIDLLAQQDPRARDAAAMDDRYRPVAEAIAVLRRAANSQPRIGDDLEHAYGVLGDACG